MKTLSDAIDLACCAAAGCAAKAALSNKPATERE
jgi:hypothetical protein